MLTKSNDSDAIIVTRDDCPFCVLLKDRLKQDGIQYKEMRKEEAMTTGIWNENFQTVPQLWISGRHIGGYTEYMNKITHEITETQECEACHA